MPDVILVTGTINLTAIQHATSTVPVVFVQVADPVGQGFVANVRQPGGNLTGFSLLEFSLGGKWLDLVKKVTPALARVAVIFNPDMSPQYKSLMQAIEAAAPSASRRSPSLFGRLTRSNPPWWVSRVRRTVD
jgi:putative ABC transport system substrate-binding protein